MLTPDFLANSAWLQPRRILAALHNVGVRTDDIFMRKTGLEPKCQIWPVGRQKWLASSRVWRRFINHYMRAAESKLFQLALL